MPSAQPAAFGALLAECGGEQDVAAPADSSNEREQQPDHVEVAAAVSQQHNARGGQQCPTTRPANDGSRLARS